MVKVNGYDFPDDLLYNKHSLWTKISDDNIATIGITDLAQKNLEEVTYIDIIFEEGESIKINRPFGTIESGKGSITLYSAITGEITEININKDSARYDGRYGGPHPHFVCTQCKNVQDIDDIIKVEQPILDNLSMDLVYKKGYLINNFRLDFFGTCPNCQTGFE